MPITSLKTAHKTDCSPRTGFKLGNRVPDLREQGRVAYHVDMGISPVCFFSIDKREVAVV